MELRSTFIYQTTSPRKKIVHFAEPAVDSHGEAETPVGNKRKRHCRPSRNAATSGNRNLRRSHRPTHRSWTGDPSQKTLGYSYPTIIRSDEPPRHAFGDHTKSSRKSKSQFSVASEENGKGIDAFAAMASARLQKTSPGRCG